MTTTADGRVGRVPDPDALDPAERMGVAPLERRGPAAAEVASAVRDPVGVSPDVAVVEPESLPRSVGALQRLSDRRERSGA